MKVISWSNYFQLTEVGYSKLIEKGWGVVETYSYLQTIPQALAENPTFVVERIMYDPQSELENGIMQPFGKYTFFRNHYMESQKELWKKLMTHPELIELIETQGEKVIHSASKMKIIEIPDETNWDIFVTKPKGELIIVDKNHIWQ